MTPINQAAEGRASSRDTRQVHRMKQTVNPVRLNHFFKELKQIPDTHSLVFPSFPHNSFNKNQTKPAHAMPYQWDFRRDFFSLFGLNSCNNVRYFQIPANYLPDSLLLTKMAELTSSTVTRRPLILPKEENWFDLIWFDLTLSLWSISTSNSALCVLNLCDFTLSTSMNELIHSSFMRSWSFLFVVNIENK